MKNTLTKGEVADLLGITKSQIRFYELKGLLTPNKDKNGYGIYDFEEVDRLEMILMFKELGMPLSEMKQVINDQSFQYDVYLKRSLKHVVDDMISLEKKKKKLEQRLAQYDENKDQKYELLKENSRTLYVLAVDDDSHLSIRDVYNLVKVNNMIYNDNDYELCEYNNGQNNYFGFFYDGPKHVAHPQQIQIPKGTYFSYTFHFSFSEDVALYKERVVEEASRRGICLTHQNIFLEYFYYKFISHDKVLVKIQYLVQE